MSAYGVSFDTKGVAIEQIDALSPLSGVKGLQKGDLLLEMNGTRIRTTEDILKTFKVIKDSTLQLRIVRHQKGMPLTLKVN